MPYNRGYGMGFFERRWEQMQSEKIHDNRQAVGELQATLAELEKTIVYLIAKLSLGQPIELSDPVFESFLHLKNVEDKHRAALEMIAHMAAKGGAPATLVECPKCGAKVKDVPGVTGEVCGWCGHQLDTEKGGAPYR